jgi:AraC-like DNA-binding protein
MAAGFHKKTRQFRVQMMHTQSVSSYLVQAVLNAANELGLGAVSRGYQEQVQVLLQEAGRIPLQGFCLILHELSVISGDESIGLRFGQLLEPGGFNVLGHLVMASPTVGEALTYVQQLQQLVVDCADCDFRVDNEQLVFSWTPRQALPVGEKQLVDLLFSAMRSFGIWVTGIIEPFAEVRFQFAKPKDTRPYEQVFGHPGRFDCIQNAICLPLSWRDRPIRSASTNLQPLIYQQALTQCESMCQYGGLVSRISEVVAQLLPDGYATIEKVSAEVGLSSRSLQRRLQSQGVSFSDLVQQVRRQLADYYLRNTSLELGEIAARLGYREQSSFSSAYKCWTGQSPIHMRHAR